MYVEAGDLLIGELTGRLPASINVAQFLTMTAQEIDGKLGFVYQVPINTAVLPNAQGVLLKSIHRKLASGRILMAATAAHQESTLHAYGFHMVKEAQMELTAIANGDVVLFAPRVTGSGQPANPAVPAENIDPLARVPSSYNRDDRSGVESFEKSFMTNDPMRDDPWHPGRR